MNYATLKKLCLLSLLGFLSLSAVLSIATIVFDRFGETSFKIVITSLSISVASICGMACAAFVEKRGYAWLGGTGIFLSIAALAMTTGMIWTNLVGMKYGDITLTLIVLSIGFTHTLLLYLPDLLPRFHWTQHALTLSVSILSFLIILLIWQKTFDDWHFRVIGVVSVIVVLLTLTIPICAKFKQDSATHRFQLQLVQVEGNLFEDQSGNRYQVVRELEKAIAPETTIFSNSHLPPREPT